MIRSLLVLLLILSNHPRLFAEEGNDGHLLEGSYAGFLYLKDAELKIPVTLNTISIPATATESAKMAAYLKLSFGSFYSHEYLTHNYIIEDYDWSSPETILDATATDSARDLTLNLHSYEDGTILRGPAFSKRGRMEHAEIELIYWSQADSCTVGESSHWYNTSKLQTLFPNTPVFPALTGTYRSDCDEARDIQFELTKQSGLSSSGLLPLEGYVVKGRVFGDFMFGGEKTTLISHLLDNPEDFQYNFYKGRLNFPHFDWGGSCQRTADGIICDHCTFKAVEEEKNFLNYFVHANGLQIIKRIPDPIDNSAAVGPTTDKTQISGSEYRGHIQFEQRDTVRPFSVEVNVTGRPIPGDTTISKRLVTMIPRVHMQSADRTVEWQRFVAIDLPPIPMSDSTYPKIVVGRSGDIIKITKWTVSTISGVYYSASFGRVGNFAAYRDFTKIPNLEVDFTIPNSFIAPPNSWGAPQTQWTQTQLNLEWILNSSGPGTPYTIGGSRDELWSEIDSLLGKNTVASFRFRNARFDPYTGVFGLDMDDKGHTSLIATFKNGQIHYASSANELLQEAVQYHKLITANQSVDYEMPKPVPKESSLTPGSLYVYMPYDTDLYFNNLRLNKKQVNFVEMSWPETTSDKYEFTLKAIFQTGRVIEKKISIPVVEAKSKAIMVNFYELQKRP